MDSDRNLNSLKNELNETDKQKESLFDLIKDNRKKFNELNNKLNILKKERNSITDSVKKIKAERNSLNAILKTKIEAFKRIIPKKTEKPKVRVNAGFLKKEIKAMEYKIETEGLSFDKEQKLMKIIKEKKKKIEDSSYGGMSLEARNLSREIDDIRKKADESHRKMRIQADESQRKHEEVIKISNELKEIYSKQKKIESRIRECKKRMNEINEKLVEGLDKIVENKKMQQVQQREYRDREYKEKQEKYQHHKQYNKEKHFRRKEKYHSHQPCKADIEGMQRKAEEKLKKGGKLTTDDLLAFQEKK